MMSYHEAFATPFACAGVAIVLTEGMWLSARRLLRKARNLPQTVSRLAEGLVYSFAWRLADAVQSLRHHQGQHCGHAEPVAAAAPLPGPFLPAPRPADAAESMTPLGPDTAIHALLPYIPPAGGDGR